MTDNTSCPAYLPRTRKSDASVAVFAKAPVRGKCKTRLAKSIGATAAAEVQRQLTIRTVKAVVDSGYEVTLWCSPCCRHSSFIRLRQRYGVRLRRQRKGHLGKRMASALRAELDKRPFALVIGADCAGVTPAVLEETVSALRQGSDAVFVPAHDGGYVVVGVARRLPGLFHRIHWGSRRVMAQTRRRALCLGVDWSELAPSWDVDCYQDWLRAHREGWL